MYYHDQYDYPEPDFSIPLLDHGYVKYIEHWGSDERIVESARMSTDKGFQGWGREPEWVCPTCGYILADSLVRNGVTDPADSLSGRRYVLPKSDLMCPNQQCEVPLVYTEYPKGDEKLLEYLWNNKHASPFEQAGLTIEVQAPIFVFREWHRHRTQSYNELSARYTPLPDFNYKPSVNRCLLVEGGNNKQAQAVKGADTLTHSQALEWLLELDEVYKHAEAVYQSGLSRGVPKEIARCPVPVARYSRMRASANLRNWLGFLTLRMDTKAQWEIRQYANAVGTIVEHLYPRTWKLFLS